MLIYQGKSYSVVLGDEENRFPGVTDDIEKVTCDCSCNPPVPWLRCAHVRREDTECWFLVNEGRKRLIHCSHFRQTADWEVMICGQAAAMQ